MSEPRWWIKQLPTVDGHYYVINSQGVRHDCHVTDGKGEESYSDFYGPIPDPPKAPPQIRRFTATWHGQLVSGIKVDDQEGYRVYDRDPEGRAMFVGIKYENMLSDITYLDD